MSDKSLDERLTQPNIDWDKLKGEKKSLQSQKEGLEARIDKIADRLESKMGSKVSGKNVLMFILSNFEEDPDKLMMLAKVLQGVAKIQKDLTETTKKIHAISVIESDRGWFADTFLDHEPLIADAADKLLIHLEEFLSDTKNTEDKDDSQED